MIEQIGWVGTLLLSICGIPQVWKTFMKKDVRGLSVFTSILWSLGCLFLLVFSIAKDLPFALILNYIINMIIAGSLVFGYFKYRGKNEDIG